MQNFDSQLNEIKPQLQSAQNILVVLPSDFTTDELAAGLALFLSLDAMKREVSIVTEGTLHVSDSNLFGVGQISKTLPQAGGGNFVLTFEGVVASDGTVPALEKLDYFPEGNNLNLVFHVLPGQRFEPAKITPKSQGGAFSLIFAIGAANLHALGGVYTANTQAFSGATLVNIDNDTTNTQYGTINMVDSSLSTLSEMIFRTIIALGIPMDQDIASNVLNGIYSATSNLSVNVGPETFMIVGQAMQAGGKNPTQTSPGPTPINMPIQTQVQPQVQTPVQPQAQPQPQAQNIPLNQIFGFPVQGDDSASSLNQPSPEEVPTGEAAYSTSPEVSNPDPDWLTPKVYKGGNIG